jgi:hypothetical protein
MRTRFLNWVGPTGDVVYELPTNQPLKPPHWTLAADSIEPEYRIVDVPGGGDKKAVQIDPRGEYALDHELGYACSEVRSIEFVGKFTEESRLYIRCRLRLQDGRRFNRWLTSQKGLKTPKKVSRAEWEIYIEPRKWLGDWESLIVIIDDQWPYTFGTQDIVYLGIVGFRLRGPMSIARITARK